MRPAWTGHGGSDWKEEVRPEGFEAVDKQRFSSLFSAGIYEDSSGLQIVMLGKVATLGGLWEIPAVELSILKGHKALVD